MKSSASKIQLSSYEDLFQTSSEKADERERVQEVPLSELFAFKSHPFRVKDDEAMQETAESIVKYGVLIPGIVRSRPEGGYEIIAGHRRKRGSELAGRETMPVIVRELDDDEAIIVLVDSNLQRERILPSEKAFAYRMKLEAMKRQGQRTDLTLSPVATRLDSAAILGQQSGESRDQVFRYIRLTNLIPELLGMVDNSVSKEPGRPQLALRPAVELSYLPENEQRFLLDIMMRENCIPSQAQAVKMRKFSQDGKLTAAVIEGILSAERTAPVQITLKKDRLKQYFPPTYTAQQMEEVIISLLDTWRMQNAPQL